MSTTITPGERLRIRGHLSNTHADTCGKTSRTVSNLAILDTVLRELGITVEEHTLHAVPTPAADQTPATDSERDERLRGIQERVDHHSPEEFGSETVGWLLALLAEQAATIERVTRLVRDLTDPDDCWFDHNGGCQAHGYLSLRPGDTCPQADAKALALGSQRTEGQG